MAGGPTAQTGNSEVVGQTIDALGFGWFQVMMLVLTGGVMFAEGAEMLVMGSITTLLRDHWDITAWMRGLMVSIVFVGFSVGNMTSGYVGDRFGRRKGVLLSYLIIGVCGFATACASGPGTMLLLRFLVGVGCGIGFPAVYSLIPEVCPTHLRGSICTLMIGFMPFGEFYAAWGVVLIDPNLERSSEFCEVGYYPSRALGNPEECSWKTLCEFSAVPAFFFGLFALLFLRESPHFLYVQGRYEELESVLSSMAWMNGQELDFSKLRLEYKTPEERKIEEAKPSHSFSGALGRLLGPRYYRTTYFMFAAHFTKDFAVFGLAYVLPQYFKFLEGLPAGEQLMTVAALAGPGVILTVLLTRCEHIGHIPSISLTACLSAVFALGMLELSPDHFAAPAAYAVKVCSLSYFIVTIVYTAEVFPTVMRNTAVGLCTCMGRLGSISAPLIFEISHADSKSFDIFVGILLSLMGLVGVTAPFCLTHEPKGKDLAEEIEDILGPNGDAEK